MTFFLGVIVGWLFLVALLGVLPFGRTVATLCPLVWPLFRLLPHPHLWRPMTSEADYGRFGRHWGEYHGQDEEECVLCGMVKSRSHGGTEWSQHRYARWF
jgi:hypothetical protein